ncbi:MAG: HAD family hydrolase [Rhabdochlamydiaceae bacterium]|nr:HAD family hydrolase [Candidatus Amphrikana amoebophyrae]
MSSQEKGIIALDIDGTIAKSSNPVPVEGALALKSVYELGWTVFFITGRSFAFAKKALQHVDFPIYLALQNGADIIEYPSKEEIFKSYISKSILDFIEPFYENKYYHYIVYSGIDKGDFCYYNPAKFSAKMGPYLEKLKEFSDAQWVEIDSGEDVQDKVSLVKCFGEYSLLQEIADSLEGVSCSIIRDTVDPDLFIMLITAGDANKGCALDHIKEIKEIKGPALVGGNDRNDISMLDKGDYRMVVEGSPKEVLEHADVIVEDPLDLGIINEIKRVIDGNGNFIK